MDKMLDKAYARMTIFNQGEKTRDGMDIEFGECSHCGKEMVHGSGHYGGYPARCPECGRYLVKVVLA